MLRNVESDPMISVGVAKLRDIFRRRHVEFIHLSTSCSIASRWLGYFIRISLCRLISLCAHNRRQIIEYARYSSCVSSKVLLLTTEILLGYSIVWWIRLLLFLLFDEVREIICRLAIITLVLLR